MDDGAEHRKMQGNYHLQEKKQDPTSWHVYIT